MASNPAGTVLAAAAIPGSVFLSRDSGATWVNSGLPQANWISVDMDATGQTLVALQFGGGMYRSTNGGTTWTRIDTAFNASNLDYESVTVSQDGQRIVATVLNGPIYVSTNGGTTFTTAGGSAVGAHDWRAVDSSADGSVVVAVTQAGTQPGQVHVSTDGGATFTVRPVPLGGAANPSGWYRVAVSDDGNTFAVAGNTDFAGTSTGLFVSRDRGATWVQGNSAAGAYTSIDTSANGDIIAATLSGPTGQVLVSTNGGTSFAPVTAPSGETNWRALAMNSAATRLILAAGTFGATNGQVYLSSGTIAAPAATPAAPAAAPATAPATTPAPTTTTSSAGTATGTGTGTGFGTGTATPAPATAAPTTAAPTTSSSSAGTAAPATTAPATSSSSAGTATGSTAPAPASSTTSAAF